MVNVKPLRKTLQVVVLFTMSTKVILIKIIADSDGEPLPNSRKKFNPMSAKDLEN